MDILLIIPLFLIVLSLLWMAWIDLKLWILPNELMIAFFISVCAWHSVQSYEDWLYYIIGMIVGGGVLWLIRAVANRIYGIETLGFGDVKLMAVGGLWLGPEHILMALSVGAFLGVCHAVSIFGYKKFIEKQAVSLNRMALPAGPGFIAGLLIIALMETLT